MNKIHPVALGNMVLWVAVILAAAVLLRGTEQAGMMVVILGGAAGVSICLVHEALRKGNR